MDVNNISTIIMKRFPARLPQILNILKKFYVLIKDLLFLCSYLLVQLVYSKRWYKFNI